MQQQNQLHNLASINDQLESYFTLLHREKVALLGRNLPDLQQIHQQKDEMLPKIREMISTVKADRKRFLFDLDARFSNSSDAVEREKFDNAFRKVQLLAEKIQIFQTELEMAIELLQSYYKEYFSQIIKFRTNAVLYSRQPGIEKSKENANIVLNKTY